MSDVPLREYVDAAVKTERDLREQQFAAALRSVNDARENVDMRLKSMNELRDQINNERGTFISRDWFERCHNAIDCRVRDLERFASNMHGRLWAVTASLLILQIVIGTLSLLWRK